MYSFLIKVGFSKIEFLTRFLDRELSTMSMMINKPNFQKKKINIAFTESESKSSTHRDLKRCSYLTNVITIIQLISPSLIADLISSSILCVDFSMLSLQEIFHVNFEIFSVTA